MSFALWMGSLVSGWLAQAMDRSNHYEAAFAAFLRERRICHVPVDETRRSCLNGIPIKSVDFILHGILGERWVVDIKGRRYPGGTPEKPRRHYESWTTQSDVIGAQRWASHFGPDYKAMFIFVYHLTTPDLPLHNEDTLWSWHERKYVLTAVPVEEYSRVMKLRSVRWGTVHLGQADRARLIRPLHYYLPESRGIRK